MLKFALPIVVVAHMLRVASATSCYDHSQQSFVLVLFLSRSQLDMYQRNQLCSDSPSDSHIGALGLVIKITCLTGVWLPSSGRRSGYSNSPLALSSSIVLRCVSAVCCGIVVKRVESDKHSCRCWGTASVYDAFHAWIFSRQLFNVSFELSM